MRGARMPAPCVEVLPILGKPSAPVEPGDGALDNPTAGKHHESFGVIGALDARIKAMRIDTGPPFSALLTLWLSMMAAVGLASCLPRSRHST
jgi:hypothetical protein